MKIKNKRILVKFDEVKKSIIENPAYDPDSSKRTMELIKKTVNYIRDYGNYLIEEENPPRSISIYN